MQSKVTVDEWVDMFREIGLDDPMMAKWHHIFESRHPDAHQSFLEWLGLTSQKIEEIRGKSK